MQMVCDHKCKVINVTANWPGGTHDAHIFAASGLGRHMARGQYQSVWNLNQYNNNTVAEGLHMAQ